MQERQRRTNHSESFSLWGATFLHNPWHRGPEARWMPCAPLSRRRHKHIRWRRRRHTSPAQRYYITPEGGALNPPVRRSRSQAEPLAPRAKGPAAPSTLTPIRACQPSEILESTAQVPDPGPDPDRAERRLNPQAQAVSGPASLTLTYLNFWLYFSFS